ncbi:MAG: hypothetical protein FWD27_00725 [Coriobacteriia bacterium]|nr:hypothetical protein [Coriobacteriia bacterium]
MLKTSTEQLVQNIYRKVAGELDHSVTPDSEDGQTIVSIINEQVDYYFNAVDRYGERVLWVRNIDPEYVIGVSDGRSTLYEIDWTEVQALPDGFYTSVKVGGVDYQLVPHDQLHDNRNDAGLRCSVTAEGLAFVSPPARGEIRLPCVPHGGHLKGDEQDVEEVTKVHNLLWLAWATAAEYVRTDIVRGAQYPNILAQANDVYNRMLSDNEARTAPLTYDWSTEGSSASAFRW